MSQGKKNDKVPATLSSNKKDTYFLELLKPHAKQYTSVGYIVFHVNYETKDGKKNPIKNAQIIITKELNNSYYYSKLVTTNEHGKSDPTPLPTLCKNAVKKKKKEDVYTTYNAIINAPNMEKKDIQDIPIFEGITSVQTVTMRQKERKYTGDKCKN